LLLPGNEPQFLDSPARTAVATPTDIFQPAVSRRKHKYGKVNFQRENTGLLEGDVIWQGGELRPLTSYGMLESYVRLKGRKLEAAGSCGNAGLIISTRINGVKSSRKLNFRQITVAYLLYVTGQLLVVPNQK